MKALVTGGSGYFGSVLIDKLIENGWEVGSLDINEPTGLPKRSFLEFQKVPQSDV